MCNMPSPFNENLLSIFVLSSTRKPCYISNRTPIPLPVPKRHLPLLTYEML